MSLDRQSLWQVFVSLAEILDSQGAAFSQTRERGSFSLPYSVNMPVSLLPPVSATACLWAHTRWLPFPHTSPAVVNLAPHRPVEGGPSLSLCFLPHTSHLRKSLVALWSR